MQAPAAALQRQQNTRLSLLFGVQHSRIGPVVQPKEAILFERLCAPPYTMDVSLWTASRFNLVQVVDGFSCPRAAMDTGSPRIKGNI